MSRWALGLAVAALVASGCKCAPTSAKCNRLVDATLKCDPSAAGAPRGVLESGCSSRLHCADIDTTTPEGCGRFMGCLYDG